MQRHCSGGAPLLKGTNISETEVRAAQAKILFAGATAVN
jgi:hypothetical protein